LNLPVLGAPALDEAHAYGAHPRQLVHRLEALAHRLAEERRKLLVVEDLQVAPWRQTSNPEGQWDGQEPRSWRLN
jgi:hypothetical protein